MSGDIKACSGLKVMMRLLWSADVDQIAVLIPLFRKSWVPQSYSVADRALLTVHALTDWHTVA